LELQQSRDKSETSQNSPGLITWQENIILEMPGCSTKMISTNVAIDFCTNSPISKQNLIISHTKTAKSIRAAGSKAYATIFV
jgi:hypothetical protein